MMTAEEYEDTPQTGGLPEAELGVRGVSIEDLALPKPDVEVSFGAFGDPRTVALLGALAEAQGAFGPPDDLLLKSLQRKLRQFKAAASRDKFPILKRNLSVLIRA